MAPEHLLLLHTQAHVELLDELTARRRATRAAARAARTATRRAGVLSGLRSPRALLRRALGFPGPAQASVATRDGAACGCCA